MDFNAAKYWDSSVIAIFNAHLEYGLLIISKAKR